MATGRRGGFRMLLAIALTIALCGFALPGAWAAPIAGQELVPPPIVVAPVTGMTKLEAWVLLRQGYFVRQAHWPTGQFWWMARSGALAYCVFQPAPEGDPGIWGLGFVIANLRVWDDTPNWLVVLEEVVDVGK